jgi:hypothetical protein
VQSPESIRDLGQLEAEERKGGAGVKLRKGSRTGEQRKKKAKREVCFSSCPF